MVKSQRAVPKQSPGKRQKLLVTGFAVLAIEYWMNQQECPGVDS